MKTKNYLTGAVFIMISCLFHASAVIAEGVRTLEWEDLVPKGVKSPAVDMGRIDHSGAGPLPSSPAQADAPIVPALDQQIVKIAGFAVPLEGDDKGVTEFLMVPYYGACIHVPPPPANQIIYVIAEPPLSVDLLSEPFWVTGTLSTKGVASELADSGYSLVSSKIEAYQY